MTRFLDVEDLLVMIRVLNVGPVREPGLLASATARPRGTILGAATYPTPDLQAAAMLHSVAGHLPLIDGNKRLAWLATVTFLRLNGHDVDLTHDDAFDLVMAVASGETREVTEIAERLRVTPRA